VSNELWWYVARAGGITAWSLATASVALGTIMGAILVRKPGRAWQLDLHRFLGAATVVFVAIHVVGLLSDSVVPFDLTAVAVPLAATWHPVAVAWGVVAMWLLVAVELTSLVRDRLPNRLWHRIHVSSYAVFALGTVHALASGTDASGDLAAWVALTVSTVVGVLVFARLLEPERREARVYRARQRMAERSAP
jgi:DMSO/TMAO reductase YedYZ heme-binding membrane subunit